jgi:superfamily I DNA/RNA helicase
MRQRLLDEVLQPYEQWKLERSAYDWNDLAVDLASGLVADPYHIVVVDEAQDFSANQVRAVTMQLADTHSVTYVLDAAQRIYPRHFRWAEAGVTIAPNNSFRLGTNYRNTAEIAAFAAPLLSNLDVTDDGTIPDFSACSRHGPKPVVVAGRFQEQLSYVIQDLERRRNDPTRSSAILHAAGGGWFREVRRVLSEAALPYVELTRQAEWPQGEETIALSTMHSAKGLEFDHVYIVGLNAEVTPHGTDPEDSGLENYRRLLAMAVTRARESVMLGYKPQEASSLVEFLAPGTFDVWSPR